MMDMWIEFAFDHGVSENAEQSSRVNVFDHTVREGKNTAFGSYGGSSLLLPRVN